MKTLVDLIEWLDIDSVLALADELGIEWTYPSTDDEWPDWEDEIRVQIMEEMEG